MRAVASADRIREFMRRLGESAGGDTRIYLTGGATAVLLGWRETTVDVDLKIAPDRDDVLKALARLKDTMDINVELASPPDFIPALPDWEARSLWIGREGKIDWHHFDFYSQALSKIERGHAADVKDVEEMVRRRLVDPAALRAFFERIRPELFRYPAIDPDAFAGRVEAWVRRSASPA